jgi:MFS family permease
MTWVTGMTTGLGHAFHLRGFSAIFKPLSTELGFSRAITSGASGIRSLQFGIMAPVTGWLCDRFGPKWVILSGLASMIMGLLLMTRVHSLWAYYVTWGVIMGLGNSLALTIAPDKALTDWFVAKRGRALSIRFILIALVSAVFLPIITWMITTLGWRTSCLIWAGVMGMTVPFIWVTIKQKRPEYYDLLPDGAEIGEKPLTTQVSSVQDVASNGADFEEREHTLGQAMKTLAYWMLITADASGMIVFSGFTIHCIPFITDLGIDPTVAGSLMAMMIVFTIPSTLLSGLIADRISKEHLRLLLAGAYLSQALGIATFLIYPHNFMLYPLLILMGFGTGAMRPLLIIIRGRYFGRKAYGSIEGTSMTFQTPFSILSPVYAGWIYDTTGSYMTAFTLFASLAVFSTFIMYLARYPKIKRMVNSEQ